MPKKLPTKKAYVMRQTSGWSVGFWNGPEVRYLHGFSCWGVAVGIVREFWHDPPDLQNGFSTVCEIRF
jgi:hypothetical protein